MPTVLSEAQWFDVLRIHGGDSLEQALSRFCCTAQEILPAAGVSLTVLAAQGPSTVASSQPAALDLDNTQYAFEEGPCVLAATRQLSVAEPDLAGSTRWPRWGPVALAAGIGCVHSAAVSGTERPRAAMNVYGPSPHSLESREVLADIERLRVIAGVVLDNASVYAAAGVETAQLRDALVSRASIEQAKGVLVAQEHMSPDAAWEYLVKMSQHSHRKLRDIAALVVTRAQGLSGPPEDS